MFRVVFLQLTPAGPKLRTITTPDRAAAEAVHDAFRLAGVHVRMWRGDTLYLPSGGN